MGLVDSIKEKLGRKLSVDEMALADRGAEQSRDRFGLVTRTRYRRLPGGIRVESETMLDDVPFVSRRDSYDSQGLLMARCDMTYTGGVVDVKVVKTYDPPGRWIGKSYVSRPWPYY
jgi:hypothetical protein